MRQLDVGKRGTLAALRGAFLCALLAPGAGAAWDADLHAAIVRTALVVSPAVEARFAPEFRDALLASAAEADLTDPSCRYHRGPEASKDPAVEVERTLAELARPLRPYRRAQVIGRLLHYAADCTMPKKALSGATRTYWASFLDNHDVVVFRQPRPLAPPLLSTLRSRGEEALFGDDATEMHPAVFRLAVNLVADVALLLPPIAGHERTPDGGKVLFVVNRLDNGREFFYFRNRGYFYEPPRRPWQEPDDQPKPLLEREPGVQVVDWAIKKYENEKGAVLRALLFNNQDKVACRVTIVGGEWSTPVRVSLAPGAVETVTVDIPPLERSKRPEAIFEVDGCDAKRAAGLSIADAEWIVRGANGSLRPYE